MKKTLLKILKALMGNALFWIFAIFGGMVLFILLFERFSRFGVDAIYHLF